MIASQIGGSNMSSIASLLGVAGDKAPSALQSGIAAVLAGLASNALGGLLLLALLLHGFCIRARTAETVREVSQVVQERAKQAGAAAVNLAKVVLPGGETIDVVTGSFKDAFASFLASNPTDLTRRLAFDVIEFETGSAYCRCNPA